jgi:hypothetical protein
MGTGSTWTFDGRKLFQTLGFDVGWETRSNRGDGDRARHGRELDEEHLGFVLQRAREMGAQVFPSLD